MGLQISEGGSFPYPGGYVAWGNGNNWIKANANGQLFWTDDLQRLGIRTFGSPQEAFDIQAGNAILDGNLEGTYMWRNQADQPRTSSTPGLKDYIGNDGDLVLCRPDNWAYIVVNSTGYVVPCYALR